VREPADDAEDRRGTPAAAEETSSGGADLREEGERWAEKDWGNQIADCSQSAGDVEAVAVPGPCSR